MLKQVKGMEGVLKKMAAAKFKTGDDVGRGLKRGGLFLQGKSTDVVPVQIGNLKNSAFCRNVGGAGTKTDVVVGYTAGYAAVVHEDLEKTHGQDFNVKHADKIATHPTSAAGGMFKRGEEQQPKYLEEPARKFRKKILRIVYGEAKF